MAEIGFNGERINRFFKDEYSEKESLYVDDVFSDNKNEKELEHFLRRQFYELLPEDDKDKKDLDHILYRIHYDINNRSVSHKRDVFNNAFKWTLRIAGIILLPVLIYFGIEMYKETGISKQAWVEINSPAWTRTQFRLPDGTVGWLNSNSSIRYYGNFASDRQLTLKGEAYFDVFKDEKNPFVVNVYDVALKVLGTKFNVTAYEDERNVEVVLEGGSLVFNTNDKTQSYLMKPDDMVIYDKNLNNLSVEVVQSLKYTSWTQGKLVFRNDPIDVIAKRLERYYNVDIEVDGKVSNDMRLRATFIDEDINEVLGWMERSLPLSYRIENGTIMPDDTYVRKKVIITLKKY